MHNSSAVIAYGFRVEETEEWGSSERSRTSYEQSSARRDYLDTSREHANKVRNSFIQLFTTALDARRVLACSSSDVQVVISEDTLDVSPLNLAAALHKDNPLRDVYIQKSNPSALFLSRLEATGARGLISAHEAEALLGLPPAVDTAPQKISCNVASTKVDHQRAFLKLPQMKGIEPSPPSMAWLEAVLDLDELDEQDAFDNAMRLDERDAFDNAKWLDEQDAFDCPDDQGKQSELSFPSNHVEQEEYDQLNDFYAYAQHPELDGVQTVSEYTVAERTPVLKCQDLEEMQSDTFTLGTPEHPQKGSSVVAAFVSGRGGVGKSSLAVLTAIDQWQAGKKVALLDMDLQFGDVSILLGHEPESTIKRIAIEQLCSGQAQLPKLEEALLLIEPPASPEFAEELIAHIPTILARLRTCAEIVLINTSCLWDEAAGVLAHHTDKLIICMDQRATSISAARQVVELCKRLQIPSTQLEFLLNRSERNAPITDIDASLAMGGVDILTIAEGGADVDELLSLGCPVELLSSQYALRQSIKKLGAALFKGQTSPSAAQ